MLYPIRNQLFFSFNKICMIHREVLIRPCKSPGNREMYSKHKSYGIKHKKPQTGNLSAAIAQENKL